MGDLKRPYLSFYLSQRALLSLNSQWRWSGKPSFSRFLPITTQNDHLLSDKGPYGARRQILQRRSRVPGFLVGFVGHVQRIWQTDFDAIFFTNFTNFCYGLVL